MNTYYYIILYSVLMLFKNLTRSLAIAKRQCDCCKIFIKIKVSH